MKKIVISLLLLTSTAVYAEEQQWSGPDFLIIGAAKCGTTALYNYLIKHPQIQSAAEKEIGFFNIEQNFKKGITWYQSKFPQKSSNDTFLTGEASTQYLPHSNPKQVAKLFPQVKIVILLRDPVDRAFSDYKMHVRNNKIMGNKFIPDFSFEELIQSGIVTLKKYSSTPNNIIAKDSNGLYIRPSLYLPLIKRWLQYFPKEQFLILLSDDLFNNPAETVNRVFRFLDLPEYTLPSYQKFNVAANNYIKMKPETREMLTTLFRPFNQELQDLLNNEFGLDIQLNWN